MLEANASHIGGIMIRGFFIIFSLSAIVGAAPAYAGSAGPFAGVWTISTATLGPWADPKNPLPDNGERASLIGHSVTIGAKSITGPRQVACPDPHYEVKTWGPDMLFQGTLKNPAQDAAALGFKGKTSKSLETGCETEIDWHMNDAGQLEFGLNDYVYTLTKAK
jgi:hypothetical protein